MKKILILGGGGFIGGHLAKRLKLEGHWVRIVDLKEHEYFDKEEISDEFIVGDLRDPMLVSRVMFAPNQISLDDKINSFDEVYQLAADMGGAGYIFIGEHDADVMHNSALINLNVAKEATLMSVKKVFYSSSACMYPEHNQLDPNNPNCEESSAYPANPDSEYGWEKLFSERLYLSFFRNYGLNVRIARFHNIFGPEGTWKGGKEKAPAAMCRKISETEDGGEIEVCGDGLQTRSFLYVDECVEAVIRLMNNEFNDAVVFLGDGGFLNVPGYIIDLTNVLNMFPLKRCLFILLNDMKYSAVARNEEFAFGGATTSISSTINIQSSVDMFSITTSLMGNKFKQSLKITDSTGVNSLSNFVNNWYTKSNGYSSGGFYFIYYESINSMPIIIGNDY